MTEWFDDLRVGMRFKNYKQNVRAYVPFIR